MWCSDVVGVPAGCSLAQTQSDFEHFASFGHWIVELVQSQQFQMCFLIRNCLSEAHSEHGNVALDCPCILDVDTERTCRNQAAIEQHMYVVPAMGIR